MRVPIAWLLLAAVAPAWAGDLPAFPFINVTGHALKAVSPDLARVNFTIKARNPGAEAAARVVSDRNSGVSSGAHRNPPHYEVSLVPATIPLAASVNAIYRPESSPH